MAVPLVLASASPRRVALLEQLNVIPTAIIPADIDETPKKKEKPRHLAERLALEKARVVFGKEQGHAVLAADTVVACGTRILPKAEDDTTVRECLTLLSGRRHHVYCGVAVIDAQGKESVRVADTIVKFKRLTESDIMRYVESGEGVGKAGGYAIQGLAAALIPWMQGEYSAVVGLPLYETRLMLMQAGVL